MRTTLRDALSKILLPGLLTVGIFTFFYLGGDAYQTFGLAAVDNTRRILKYVLGVAAFLSLAVLAQRIIRYVIFDGIVASATGAPVPKLLSQISGLLIYMVALSACAGIVFDQDLTVLWAASGVAGLVLGMALRELLQDVFAGIALNIDRAVRIGEYIQLHKAGETAINGQLLEISWRTTRIKDFSGDVVIIPNSKFSAITITNFSQPEATSYRSAIVTLDARVPPARAIRILQAAALEALTGLIGDQGAPPQPWVEVKSIKPEGAEYAIYFKAEWRFLASARPLILQAALTHLAQAGLEPAVPRQNTDTEMGLQVPGKERLAQLIGDAPLWRGLSRRDLDLLGEGARLTVEQPGRVVAQAGEAGTVLYLVLEGLLSTEASRRNGVRNSLPSMLRPGDLFDPAVVLLGEAHACTVRARTPALLCELDYDLVNRLFRSSPEAFDTVGRNLAALVPAKATSLGREEMGETGDWAEEIQRQMRHLFPGLALPVRRDDAPVSLAARKLT
ncbi:mechanosensitive ion channel family protein [Azospirillum griseum]|uniref:Small-conductance mechanosensitive channel n=1 Tax=Azospirillum griseum TaxID=2496639 RepID=A0A3S0R869_9PROT|nr:mechanosensitive ion channel family protein [Azospirillum griseum]RTR18935.1 mechanosensitive ion channel [Azospirillum griseum]